jgi:hypothetical protein
LKKFSELTSKEKSDLSNEDSKSYPPEERRDCSSCMFLKIAITAWCTNEEMKKHTGTTMAGFIKCEFWKRGSK